MSGVQKEEISFTADISQLMNLIINSFYSKKEIFIRELLSNSSDALEKIRHNSLKNPDALKSEPDLKIRVKSIEEEKCLVISDTGIGMTRDDLVNCLGTIAKSGTKAFLENVDKKDVETIGQFGVGFYSAFLVADRVKVITKHNEDKEYVWESNSDKTYTLTSNDEGILKRGTEIYLYLKETELEYLKTDRVKSIIKQYTEFINYPIEILETKEVEREVEKEEEKDSNEGVSPDEVEGVTPDGVEGVSPSKELVSEWKVVNDEKPIWSKKPEDVDDEKYKSFFKKLTGDYSDPLAYKHFHTEGNLECDCILYIPERAPRDIFESGDGKKHNIKLYVKKVFIMDDCEELLPEWLKFVRGVVDSNDIQLNVSREILQQSRVLSQIKNIIIKKLIELINEIVDDEEKFKKFYENYSKMIKLGIHEDNKNRDKLVELLRYNSVNKPDKLISLKEYVENMKEDEKSIYYICGDNKHSLARSPLIERIKEKGHDILFFTDPIDEYMIQNVSEYMEKKLVDVSKEGIKFDEDEIKKQTEENKVLIDFIKEKLGSRVTEVKVSDRLASTPCVLTTAQFGWTANMERIMKAQALRNSEMDQFMGARKIMELNPEHLIMRTLKSKLNEDESNHKKCKDIVELLYNNAILNSGFVLENASEYANKVNKMIEIGFCDIDEDEDKDEDKNEDKDEDYKKKELQIEDDNKMEEID